MTIAELKEHAYTIGLTNAMVKVFGDLRKKLTWELAINSIDTVLDVVETVYTVATSDQAIEVYKAIGVAAIKTVKAIIITVMVIAFLVASLTKLAIDRWKSEQCLQYRASGRLTVIAWLVSIGITLSVLCSNFKRSYSVVIPLSRLSI